MSMLRLHPVLCVDTKIKLLLTYLVTRGVSTSTICKFLCPTRTVRAGEDDGSR